MAATAYKRMCLYSLCSLIAANLSPPLPQLVRFRPSAPSRSPSLPADSFSRGTDVQGTVNDPTPFPAPNKAHGSYHWTFERLLSASLVPLVGATAVSSVNPILDGILSVAIVAHSHMVRE